MPLLDLKTNLKSLKYGGDRPGGGSSGQPYIQKDIPTTTNATVPFDDTFVRGGFKGALEASKTDKIRISKFFKDAPKGPLFIARQVGMQLTNPRLETKKGGNGFISTLLTGDIGPLTNGLLQPTRIYNLGVNTLAQVPVTALGQHFDRHGLLPIQDDSTKYLAVAQANNQNSKNNRLVGLKSKLIGNERPPSKARRLVGFLNNAIALLGFPFRIPTRNPQELIIDRYIGGPGSVYGIGNTLIKRYDFTGDVNWPNKLPIQEERGKINYAGSLGVSNRYIAKGSNFELKSNTISRIGTVLGSLFLRTPINDKKIIDNNINDNTPTNIPSQVDQTPEIYAKNFFKPVVSINYAKALGVSNQYLSSTSSTFAETANSIINNIDLRNPTVIPSQIDQGEIVTYQKLREKINTQINKWIMQYLGNTKSNKSNIKSDN